MSNDEHYSNNIVFHRKDSGGSPFSSMSKIMLGGQKSSKKRFEEQNGCFKVEDLHGFTSSKDTDLIVSGLRVPSTAAVGPMHVVQQRHRRRALMRCRTLAAARRKVRRVGTSEPEGSYECQPGLGTGSGWRCLTNFFVGIPPTRDLLCGYFLDAKKSPKLGGLDRSRGDR